MFAAALVDAGRGCCRPFAPLPAVLPKANLEKLRGRARPSAALSVSPIAVEEGSHDVASPIELE